MYIKKKKKEKYQKGENIVLDIDEKTLFYELNNNYFICSYCSFQYFYIRSQGKQNQNTTEKKKKKLKKG